MRHLKEPLPLKERLKVIFESFFPNRKDNARQIVIKSISIVCIVTLIVSSVYIISYFAEASNQENILDETREIWNTATENTSDNENSNPIQVGLPQTFLTKLEAMELLKKQNPDFTAWLAIPNANVDNPVYQTDNNDYYLTRNQKGQKSAYGALYFDCDNVIRENEFDSNILIFGHEMKNGTMFGSLKKYRKLDFYKSNPTVSLTTFYGENTYQIFSVFVLNADKNDDNGYVFDIFKKNVSTDAEFSGWISEVYERSLINANIEVTKDDEILTLVTCCNDFKNARLIIMAKKLRDGEIADTSKVTVSKAPRYPKRWYDDRGYTYPYN